MESQFGIIRDPAEEVPDQQQASESYHRCWQDQTVAITEDCYKLQCQIETLQRDRERDADVILSLRQVCAKEKKTTISPKIGHDLILYYQM
jgi:hypothetical protein